MNNLAYIAGEQGDTNRAAEYLSTAIQVNDKCAECFNNLGSILFKQGKQAEARKMFERAVAIDAKYADAELNLAVALEGMSDWLGAAENYQSGGEPRQRSGSHQVGHQRATWMAEIAGATVGAPAGSKRDVAGGK